MEHCRSDVAHAHRAWQVPYAWGRLRISCRLSCRTDTPVTLDYKIMEGSLYNTPPCWSIYVCGLVFKHLLAAGGLPGVKANNDAKAKLVRCLSAPLLLSVLPMA